MHVVSTAIDMPEGVALSDGDDNDQQGEANDPHRALDINLDEPMEQERYVPKRPPQVLKTVAKPVGEKAETSTTASDAKKAKQKKKKKEEEQLVEEEPKKKSSKDKKKTNHTGLVDLTTDEPVPPVVKSAKVTEEKVSTDKKVKKEKRKHKDKDKDKKPKVAAELVDSQLLGGYEEAIGISTPSKEFA